MQSQRFFQYCDFDSYVKNRRMQPTVIPMETGIPFFQSIDISPAREHSFLANFHEPDDTREL